MESGQNKNMEATTMTIRRNQKLRKSFFFTIGILWGLIVITCSTQCFAEDLTLSLSSTSGSPNQNVSVTLSLSYPDGATASGFQLDINYDTDVLENPTAEAGQILINAGKDLSTSSPSAGVFGIVAAGPNKNIIQAGNAATISFHIKATAPPGQTDLTLSNLAASDPDSLPLDAIGNDGSIDVSAGVPTLSEWGIIILVTVLLAIGVVMLRRRRIA
jgi:hypothetical protein